MPDSQIEEVPYQIPWVLKPVQESVEGSTLATGLPEGFDAYRRIFHPFTPWDWDTSTPVPAHNRTTWRTLAQRAEVEFGPTITWNQLRPVLPESEQGRPLAVWEGELELNTASALFDLLDHAQRGPYYFGFDLPAVIISARNEPLMFSSASLSSRLPICTEAVPWKGSGYNGTATYVWPSDKRWIVWTDYDLSSTFVAATAEIVELIDANDVLESAAISLTDRIDRWADDQLS